MQESSGDDDDGAETSELDQETDQSIHDNTERPKANKMIGEGQQKA